MVLSFWIHCLCALERDIEANSELLQFKEQLEILYIS